MTTPLNSVSLSEFKEEWLQEIVAEDPSPTVKGHRFSEKIIRQWLDIEEIEEDQIIFCDGAGDGGIDIAIHIKKEFLDGGETDSTSGDTWYLVQSKYGKAFQGDNTILSESRKVIETLEGRRTRLSSLAQGVKERLDEFRGRINEMDKLILVFATTDSLTDTQKQCLRDVHILGKERIGQYFDVECVSIDTIFERLQDRNTDCRGIRIRVPLTTSVAKSGNDLWVGTTYLLDLFNFLKAYNAETSDLDQLFEKNVRRYLGPKRKVNKGIIQTLKESPERFGLYNNGITVVVKDFSELSEGVYELCDPYIVNGCQTTKGIWESFSIKMDSGGSGSNPELEDWMKRTETGVVVTKIAKVGSQDKTLLEAITRHTNSQNSISEKDFITLEPDFERWKKEMAERYDVFLETQRGGWDSQKTLQKQHRAPKEFQKFANAFDLLKIYGSGWLCEAGTAFGRNAAFVPGGSIYKRIVGPSSQDENESPFGTEDFYAAYLLSMIVKKVGFGRGVNIRKSRRQTKYLFCLVFVNLLKRVMKREGLPHLSRDISCAIDKLSRSDNTEALDHLVSVSLEVIDGYMTEEEDNNVFQEESYASFNHDLNRYMKWERLGKSQVHSPRLFNFLNIMEAVLGRPANNSPAPRSIIAEAIRQ